MQRIELLGKRQARLQHSLPIAVGPFDPTNWRCRFPRTAVPAAWDVACQFLLEFLDRRPLLRVCFHGCKLADNKVLCASRRTRVLRDELAQLSHNSSALRQASAFAATSPFDVFLQSLCALSKAIRNAISPRLAKQMNVMVPASASIDFREITSGKSLPIFRLRSLG